MSTQKKTILITGSSGFIGRNIVSYLKEKYSLLTPGHKDLDLLSQSDVNRYFALHDIDTVIHCANFGGTRKKEAKGDLLEKNLRMFFNIAENKNRFSRLINLGSGAEYNKTRDLRSISEDEFGEQVPPDEYGFSKYLISRYIEKTENMYCLRLFGIFGKYEDYEFKFISNAIVKNLLHMPITIRQNVRFSWLPVEDFLPVLDYFLTHTPKKPVYNITPPSTIDLVSIVQLINSHADFKSEICVENEGFNIEYSGNNARLVEEIGDVSFTPMDTAIKDLMQYYRTILPTIDPETIRRDPYAASCKINPQKKPGN
jgi:GDP-L-fucose synthase